ncbi:MAG: AzlC family ABC transporter permease [Erysipelotrichales bacterium]|nr:AzlC family ABC transporter permease [Erysipelotrichales bacterium]
MKTKELAYAFQKTIPVLLGYIVLGMAFGILLNEAGYGVLWAFAISTLVYAGSMQFALLSFIGTPISLLSTGIMTLSINSRHIFYGLSFIEVFKKMKIKGIYMIFSLTDETYPLLCMDDYPEGVNKEQYMFYIALFNHLYWITGSVIGNLVGNIVPFDTTGMDFAMTALFVVIFLEQYLSAKSKLPAYIGISSGIVCLLIFKTDSFLLPALIQTVLILLSCKQYISERSEQ